MCYVSTIPFENKKGEKIDLLLLKVITFKQNNIECQGRRKENPKGVNNYMGEFFHSHQFEWLKYYSPPLDLNIG